MAHKRAMAGLRSSLYELCEVLPVERIAKAWVRLSGASDSLSSNVVIEMATSEMTPLMT